MADYCDKGIPGWMSLVELQWLYNIAKEMDEIAEIGSWKGRSTHALCSGCRGKVTAIDHFLGSTISPASIKEALESDIYSQFVGNTKEFKNLIINRKNSLEAAKEYQDGYFDMAFIDGDHAYEAVKRDIIAWLPKARKLICGHDYHTGWPTIKQAVNEIIGPLDGIVGTIWYKWLIPKDSHD